MWTATRPLVGVVVGSAGGSINMSKLCQHIAVSSPKGLKGGGIGGLERYCRCCKHRKGVTSQKCVEVSAAQRPIIPNSGIASNKRAVALISCSIPVTSRLC